MNYEKEYNKLFEYFSNRTQDTYRIKTCDDLIQTYSNYDVLYQPDFTDLHDLRQTEDEKETKVLEDLTSIIETLKTQLKELRKSVSKKSRQKIDDLIELAYTRKSIYCSENDKPTKQHVKEFHKSFPLIEKPEGYVGANILKSEYHVVYSDEYVGPESEETIHDNEIPDW